MPAARIVAILTEIGEISHNQRVKELAIELGTLLAANVDNTDSANELATSANASITRLKENATNAILDTEATLEDRITDLRTAVLGLTQLYQRRIAAIEERNEAITGRVHTLANHMMAVEQKVSELAEAVTLLLDQSTDESDQDAYNSDYSDAYSDGYTKPLVSPYDGK